MLMTSGLACFLGKLWSSFIVEWCKHLSDIPFCKQWKGHRRPIVNGARTEGRPFTYWLHVFAVIFSFQLISGKQRCFSRGICSYRLDRCVSVCMANISVVTLGQILQLISHYRALLLWQLLGTVSSGIAVGWEGCRERGCSSKCLASCL